MWGILAGIVAIIGVIILVISSDSISWLGAIIGFIILLCGAPVCIMMGYFYTKNTYNVEIETQKIVSVNGEEKAIRLRIYKNNTYYDIELPIEEDNGETKLSLTQSEIDKLEYK